MVEIFVVIYIFYDVFSIILTAEDNKTIIVIGNLNETLRENSFFEEYGPYLIGVIIIVTIGSIVLSIVLTQILCKRNISKKNKKKKRNTEAQYQILKPQNSAQPKKKINENLSNSTTVNKTDHHSGKSELYHPFIVATAPILAHSKPFDDINYSSHTENNIY